MQGRKNTFPSTLLGSWLRLLPPPIMKDRLTGEKQTDVSSVYLELTRGNTQKWVNSKGSLEIGLIYREYWQRNNKIIKRSDKTKKKNFGFLKFLKIFMSKWHIFEVVILSSFPSLRGNQLWKLLYVFLKFLLRV